MKKFTRFGGLVRPPAWKQSRPYSTALGAHTGPNLSQSSFKNTATISWWLKLKI